MTCVHLHCTPNIVSMFVIYSLLPQVMTSDSHQFRMALMQFVSQLAMVPVPPPGSLGIVRSCFGMSSIIVVFLSNISCGPIMLVGSRVYILVFDFDL